MKPADQFFVFEHDWTAAVSLTLRQHVGLFLDHRDNRRRVQLMASGKRVANLFSYTCAFGIAAAKAGCEVVMNVDAAASTLALGKQNFEVNGLTSSRAGKFIEKDVRVWLEKQRIKELMAATRAGILLFAIRQHSLRPKLQVFFRSAVNGPNWPSLVR